MKDRCTQSIRKVRRSDWMTLREFAKVSGLTIADLFHVLADAIRKGIIKVRLSLEVSND